MRPAVIRAGELLTTLVSYLDQQQQSLLGCSSGTALTWKQVETTSSPSCSASTSPGFSAEAPSGCLNGDRAETSSVTCQPIKKNESLDQEVIRLCKCHCLILSTHVSSKLLFPSYFPFFGDQHHLSRHQVPYDFILDRTLGFRLLVPDVGSHVSHILYLHSKR